MERVQKSLLEGLVRVPLALGRLEQPLDRRLLHLLFVARYEVRSGRLLYQAPDEGDQGQSVHVVRLAEVIGQKAVVERCLLALRNCGPHELATERRLSATWPAHDQRTARFGGRASLQAVLDFAERPLSAKEPFPF